MSYDNCKRQPRVIQERVRPRRLAERCPSHPADRGGLGLPNPMGEARNVNASILRVGRADSRHGGAGRGADHSGGEWVGVGLRTHVPQLLTWADESVRERACVFVRMDPSPAGAPRRGHLNLTPTHMPALSARTEIDHHHAHPAPRPRGWTARVRAPLGCPPAPRGLGLGAPRAAASLSARALAAGRPDISREDRRMGEAEAE
eukprot:scaffold3826_cov407-Prasinococcus_capsulatus_cf.AAC.17